MMNMTSWPKVARQCHRTYPRLSRSRSFVHRNLRQQSTGTTAKTDFLEIEKRWQSVWDSKRTRIQQDENYAFSGEVLIPLYMDHISHKTILGTLQSIRTSRKGRTLSKNHTSSVLDQIIFEGYHGSSDSNETLLAYSQKYGSEVVRACIIFSQEDGKSLPLQEQLLLNTQAWFEDVGKAVQAAHRSFLETQAYCSDTPPNIEPDDRSDPDFIDDIIDYGLKCTQSMVRIAPHYDPTWYYLDKDAWAISLVSQKAIIAMTRKSSSVNYQNFRLELHRLVLSIIHYGEYTLDEHEDPVAYEECEECPAQPGTHYHSARILLSLLSIIAPAFAEECWVALHYGVGQKSKLAFDEYDSRDVKEQIGSTRMDYWDYDEVKKLGLQHLPRTDDPDTLSSIFAQAFPEPVSSEVLRTLQRKSAKSGLRYMVNKYAKIDKNRWEGTLMKRED